MLEVEAGPGKLQGCRTLLGDSIFKVNLIWPVRLALICNLSFISGKIPTWKVTGLQNVARRLKAQCLEKCSHGFSMFTNIAVISENQILFKPSGVASRTNVCRSSSRN